MIKFCPWRAAAEEGQSRHQRHRQKGIRHRFKLRPMKELREVIRMAANYKVRRDVTSKRRSFRVNVSDKKARRPLVGRPSRETLLAIDRA